MFPGRISPVGIRYEKMDLGSEHSIVNIDNGSTITTPVNLDSVGKKDSQKKNLDFGATFLADLYSNPDWENKGKRLDFVSLENVLTIGDGANEYKYDSRSLSKEQTKSFTLPESFCPVYTVKNEVEPPNSRKTSLEVVEMYVKRNTPFKWTYEYKELDLEKLIEAYNSIAKGMEFPLHEDGVNFGGQINVNLNLNQEISVVENVSPKSTTEPTPELTMTSMTLPQNTTEIINIDSKTTARKLIMNLFEKHRIVAHPRKYALYEYVQEIDKAAGTLTKKLTQISDEACPLKMVLNWPIPHCGRALVLMENRDILEDDFEIPLNDIFARISGLECYQVNVRKHKNPRTGLDVTKFSERKVMSIEDDQRKRNMWMEIFSSVFLGFAVGMAILMFGLAIFYAPSKQERFERDFPKEFFMQYLREFFEEFPENKSRGIASCNCAKEL